MAIYRVTTFGHMVDGEQWEFTWHVDHTAGAAGTVASTAADAVTAMWSGTNSPAGNLTGIYPTTIGVDGVRADELNSVGKNVSQSTTTLNLDGTSSDEGLPASVAICCSLRTASPTKGGRGRFFLPSPDITVMLSQKLDSTVQTAIKNAALAALNHMLDNDCAVVIYHRESGDFDQVTAVDVGDVPDVQSRRRNASPETRVRSTLS